MKYGCDVQRKTMGIEGERNSQPCSTRRRRELLGWVLIDGDSQMIGEELDRIA